MKPAGKFVRRFPCFEGKMPLRIVRHAAVETKHRSGRVPVSWALPESLTSVISVHIRLMQIQDAVVQVVFIGFAAEYFSSLLYFVVEFLHRADVFFFAIFGTPDRKRVPQKRLRLRFQSTIFSFSYQNGRYWCWRVSIDGLSPTVIGGGFDGTAPSG